MSAVLTNSVRQIHTTQELVRATGWRFESSLPHHRSPLARSGGRRSQACGVAAGAASRLKPLVRTNRHSARKDRFSLSSQLTQLHGQIGI